MHSEVVATDILFVLGHQIMVGNLELRLITNFTPVVLMYVHGHTSRKLKFH